MLRSLAPVLILIIGLGTPALAVDRGSGDTLADAQELVANENWTAALGVLKRVVAAAPEDADALNLLAYTLRHTGDLRNAEGFYLKALDIVPDHIGANEYLGELYVETGQLDKAAERLAVLETACGKGCEEYIELRALIEAAD